MSGLRSAILGVLLSALPVQAATPDGNAHFENKIRPVLIESCYKCHSTEKDAKIKGDLRVDTREGLLKGGATGKPSVVPGDPDKSLLIEAIRYHNEDMRMPPKAKLPEQVVQDFEAWVKMGAPDPRVATADAAAPYAAPAADSVEAKSHWAFKPIAAPPVPAVDAHSGWAKTPIDQFVLAKLASKQLSPVAPASKQALIRRATFDLTGLPPTPAEVEAFLADPSPDAFSKVIERLLALPAYGERWGRHWLDVARYADTAGESADYPIPQAVKYRDYVIASVNADKPYDQFIREQIAGDLMPSDNEQQRRERIIATGFVALAKRFSVSPDNQMHLTIEDTLDTTGKAVLGLSLSCARCHDHKFDPISAADYYALYGIFQSTRFPFPGSENLKFQRDFVPLISKSEADRILGPHQAALAEAQKEYADAKRLRSTVQTSAERNEQRAKERAAQKKASDLAVQMPDVENAYAVVDATETGDARIHKRGEPGDLGDRVPRGFLTVLGGQKLPASFEGSGRLQLAQWLTDPSNPLTPRVMVNRIWHHHFGRGLVATVNDFGFRGTPPTHPELLDYLARAFVDSGWSQKAMHRLIMQSAVYQLSTADDPKNVAADPSNTLLWRFERNRLDAEQIRDAMLSVSGALDASPGGAHPFPPKNKWGFTQHAPFTAVYDSNKRSVYLMVQRIRRHPYLAIFDGADPNFSTGQRLISTTPLQALFMMNDKFVHASADGLANRVATAGDEAQQVEQAFYLALGRRPLPEESAASQSYLREFRAKAEDEGLTKGPDAALAALRSLCRTLLASNEFVYLE